MDSIYHAICSSPSQILLEQVSQAVASEHSAFGVFWVLLDENKAVCAGNARRLMTMVDKDQLGRLCARVDDGFEPAVCTAGDGVVAAGQLFTGRGHCGYAILVLPEYSLDTAEANADLIEMLLSQMNTILEVIEKNSMTAKALSPNLRAAIAVNS